MRKSLCSIHNELATDRSELTHFQLNPAVIQNEASWKYSISAVCIGPRLTAAGGTISISLETASSSIRLESMHCRTEPSGAGRWLTVAVFPVARELMNRLATDAGVEVLVESGSHCSVYTISDENRRNMAHFLAHADRAPSSAAGVDVPAETSPAQVVAF